MQRPGMEWERIFEAIADPVMVLDTGYRIIKANKAMTDRLGIAPRAAEGKACFTLVHGTSGPPQSCPQSRLLADGLPHSVEIFEPRLGGRCLVSVSPFFAPDGRLEGSVHYAGSLSGPVPDEEEQRQFIAIIEATPDLVLIGDSLGRVRYLNRAGRNILEIGDGEDVSGTPFDVFVAIEERDYVRTTVIPAIVRDGIFSLEVRLLSRSGRTIPASAVGLAHREPDASVRFLSVIARDITERRQAERAIQESEQRYRRLVESVTDYIYTVRVENGRPVETAHGPGCVAVTGYRPEDYQADPYLWVRMIHEEDRRAVVEQATRILSGAPAAPLEHRIIHKSGAVRWVKNTPVPRCDDAGRLVAYDGLISDITERRGLEGQLRQAQKMEAVGQLAGGMAHDFNNILTAIIGYGSILQMKMAREDRLRSHVDQILGSADRGARLIRNLLAFSRKQVLDLRPLDLNEIVQRVDVLLRRVIGEDIELRTMVRTGPLIVNADQGQIEQVLMNLATNARDAMPRGGVFEVRTDLAELGEEFIRSHGFGMPGVYAVVSATDTGTGMDEATQKRIFDPFFTTKETGRGTGLGLSMVYGIVKQHNGYITVSSGPARGATFRIYLPLARTEREEGTPASSARADVLPGGTETVLVAEDDDALRNLSLMVLTDFGYRVIEARDGQEAVERFREFADDVKLVLLDMVMPRKSGREAFDEIRAMRPGVRVLFMSGYAIDALRGHGALPDGVQLVQKPLLPQDLLRKAREVLDS